MKIDLSTVLIITALFFAWRYYKKSTRKETARPRVQPIQDPEPISNFSPRVKRESAFLQY